MRIPQVFYLSGRSALVLMEWPDLQSYYDDKANSMQKTICGSEGVFPVLKKSLMNAFID